MTDTKLTRSQIKHQAILDAAKSAFQEFGVQATSMDKLAELAQVSKRTIYNHFESKEVLVMQLVADLWNKALVQNNIVFNKDSSIKEQLTQLITTEVELMADAEYIALSRVAFGHFFYHPEDLQKKVAEFSAQETSLKRWLKVAKEEGYLTVTDIDFAVTQLHNLLKGSCFWPQVMGMKGSLTEAEQAHIVNETVAIFLSRYHQV
ncbi:MAG: TetR/AcrR family transcriptional regulator [Marinomonas sp.]|uniref:TetR/AcrR family transcriptional regulator n=1 Tax=unclassified Marinomonas TaxID=196814 RepID=UPI0007AF575D|nr:MULTISPECIES: TetR/AcrR family transcriptional regulator [unclassified Marinomonas]KZM39577.1 TetR family transcriptional regulator [Marinomonas sp. SBI22]KZM41853.1 TetR family transcriptional regulator [Marinomonas sp. SBI8L]